MNAKDIKPCYMIADTWICRGETIVVTTPRGTIIGKLRSATLHFIVLDITESTAIITLDRIIWVKKK